MLRSARGAVRRRGGRGCRAARELRPQPRPGLPDRRRPARPGWREDTAGKTLGTDLAQQKLTLPVIHSLHRLPRAEADALRSAILSGGDGLCLRVLTVLEKTQSLSYARRKAEEFAPPPAANWIACPAASAARSSNRFATGPSDGSVRACLRTTRWLVRWDKPGFAVGAHHQCGGNARGGTALEDSLALPTRTST